MRHAGERCVREVGIRVRKHYTQACGLAGLRVYVLWGDPHIVLGHASLNQVNQVSEPPFGLGKLD